MWIIERKLASGDTVYSVITKDGNEGKQEAYKAACFEYAKQVSACDTWNHFTLAKRYISEKNWLSAYNTFFNSSIPIFSKGIFIHEAKSTSSSLEPEMAIY